MITSWKSYLAGVVSALVVVGAVVGGSAIAALPASGPITPVLHSADHQTTAELDYRFVTETRKTLITIGMTPDAALIQAGHYACDQVASGVSADDVIVIAGAERPGHNDHLITREAITAYCPELG